MGLIHWSGPQRLTRPIGQWYSYQILNLIPYVKTVQCIVYGISWHQNAQHPDVSRGAFCSDGERWYIQSPKTDLHMCKVSRANIFTAIAIRHAHRTNVEQFSACDHLSGQELMLFLWTELGSSEFCNVTLLWCCARQHYLEAVWLPWDKIMCHVIHKSKFAKEKKIQVIFLDCTSRFFGPVHP